MSRARQYAQDAAHAFERAPMEVALALFACITLSWSIEIGGFSFPRWLELAVPAALAFLVAWGATLLHALGRITPLQRAAITLVGGLLACAYAGWVINFEHEAEVWRAFILVAGMVAAVAAVPAFTRNADPNLAFRRINGRILLRAIGVLLYAQALFAGLALALGAVDKLFELHLHSTIYAHVLGWLMVGLVPWVVVGGLPDYVAPLQKQSEVARVVYRLALFLIPPLLALYVAILYAYGIRIGITHEVPKNLVSPMVVAAGLLAAAAIVLCDPRVDEPSALRHLRWAPAVFLPLGGLGIWAITPRISQYGWTIFRLLRLELLVVLVLLAAAGSFMVWRRRPFPLWEVAVTFAITAAVAVISGPWSTLAISKRDQQNRLSHALDEAGVNLAVPPSPADTSRRVIPGKTYDQINNTVMYLRRQYGDAALRPVLPENARNDLALADLPGYYHLRRSEPRPGPAGSFARLGGGTVVEPDSSTTARRITYNQGAPRNEPDAPLVSGDQSNLRIALGADILTVSVSDVLAAMHPHGDVRGVQLDSTAAVPVRDISGKRRGSLVLLEVSTSGDTTLTRISHLDGLLLLKNESAPK